MLSYVRDRNLEGLKKYMRDNEVMRIPGVVLDEALKQPNDGIFEFLRKSHYCDFQGIQLEKIENFKIVADLLPHCWYQFLWSGVRSHRLDIIEYLISRGTFYEFQWRGVLQLSRGYPEIVFLLLKHCPRSRGDWWDDPGILFQYAGDERADQVIRWVYRGVCFQHIYGDKLLQVKERQRERQRLLCVLCKRKNIPLVIQLNIYQFIKY